MYYDWIAVKHGTTAFGDWLISPKIYFDNYGKIPDGHSNLNIPGMEEVSDHLFRALNNSDGVSLLLAVGLVIEENPKWYWLRYTQFKCSACTEMVTHFCPGDHSGCPNNFLETRSSNQE